MISSITSSPKSTGLRLPFKSSFESQLKKESEFDILLGDEWGMSWLGDGWYTAEGRWLLSYWDAATPPAGIRAFCIWRE